MLKRIIFDIDGTLIDKVDFNELVKSELSAFGYEYDEIQLSNYLYAMNTYESEFIRYNFKDYFDYIRELSKIDISKEYMKKFLEDAGKFVPGYVHPDVILTLQYLKKKYELVVLTNFFRCVQYSRLKNSGIHEFFDEFYGGDLAIKPMSEAYEYAIGNRKKSECMMIGDSKSLDYEGAICYGMDALLFDRNLEYQSETKINNFHELRKRF